QPQTPRSSTRRSYPNLHNLSLAPLSSKYPLDASQPPSPSGEDSHHAVSTPLTSYIAQKSAPTTPGILSLSQSRSNSRGPRRANHHGHSRPYAYDGYFAHAGATNPAGDYSVREVGDIPKAKSTSAMIPPPGTRPGTAGTAGVSFAADDMYLEGGAVRRSTTHHRRKGTAPIYPLRVPMTPTKHHTSESHEEWIHRAGLAIAGETRESKGQSWLVRRESSTSLVGQTDEYEEHPSHDPRHIALLSGEHFIGGGAGDEHGFFTPRLVGSRAGSRLQSRVGSRVGSRVPSARNSRRGSRVDLMMSAPVGVGGARTPSARHSLEMERELEDGMVEPDFVDEVESDGDEEEIARLARERGFGLGSWMDRLIGWTLFSVDEDGEESDEEDDDDDYVEQDTFRPENMTKEELQLRREVEAKRRKLEREAIIAAAAVRSTADGGKSDEEDIAKLQRSNEEPGGWQDAAWLFSVASKVIL
ncbi:hypothetical protein BU24DRAFT_323065, partial [Aaosphaeria arxii CBS 175.79]